MSDRYQITIARAVLDALATSETPATVAEADGSTLATLTAHAARYGVTLDEALTDLRNSRAESITWAENTIEQLGRYVTA